MANQVYPADQENIMRNIKYTQNGVRSMKQKSKYLTKMLKRDQQYYEQSYALEITSYANIKYHQP